MEQDVKEEFIKVWEELVKMNKQNATLLKLLKDQELKVETFYVK